MAWTAPLTWVDGNTLTASQLNEQLRDNLKQCAPELITWTQRGYAVGSAANELAVRVPDKGTVLESAQTASTGYVDLTDSYGPEISINTGSSALVIWGAECANATGGFSTFASVAVSGATTKVAAS